MGTSVSATAKTAELLRIVALLDREKQRATYAAVGGTVGLPAQSLMRGQPKTPRNSWIVSAERKVPSGYARSEVHRELLARDNVISTKQALIAWLRTHA